MIRKSTLTPPHEASIKKEKWFDRNCFHIFAFAVPFVLMLIAFIRLGLYPFGDKQILVVDAWHQYFPFLKELRQKLASGDSLFWAWNIGGGTNFLALIAYYASSPLNLLSVLCPVNYLTEFVALMTLVKIALAGLSFSIFLKGIYRRSDLSTVAFSTAYALGAFSMGYYWTWMWLDGVALFPLIILGLNKLIDEGKYRMFAFSLALALISNYYIGAFICIFVAIYYVIAYLSRFSITDVRTLSKMTCRVLLFSILGVAMSAVIVLPTYFALSHASAASNTFPKAVEIYKPWLDIFNDLLSGVGPNRQQMLGSINIGCGMLSLLLVFVYAFHKKISLREKIAHIVLLIFIFLTFNINVLDFVFHGFHFPNELPHRYAFVFSFFLIAMAYRAFVSLEHVKDMHILAIMFGMVGYLLLVNKICSEELSNQAVIISIVMTLAYCVAFLVFVRKKITQLVLGTIVLILSFADGIIITQNSINEVGSSDRASYRIGLEDIDDLTYAMDDGTFFRLETNETYTINPGAMYSFKGISQFNSSSNSRVVDYMSKLGLAGNMPSNRYSYYYGSPVFDSFFNIRYIINRTGTMDSEYLSYYKQSGNATAYSYDYYLPLGFMTERTLRQLNANMGNPFTLQNSMIKLASGVDEDVYFSVPLADIASDANISLSESNGTFSFTQSDNNTSYVELTYRAERDGTAYAYLDFPKVVDDQSTKTTISINSNGVSGTPITYSTGYAHFVELGYCNAGDEIVIVTNVEANASPWGPLKSYIYQSNTDALAKHHAILADETLNIEDYSSTCIKGTVTTANGGLLYTSIPWEEGWSAKVDGKSVDIIPFNNALIALDLAQGTHTIELHFVPEGFPLGLTLSIVSLLIMVLLIVLKHFKVKIGFYAYIMGEEDNLEYTFKHEVQLTGTEIDGGEQSDIEDALHKIYEEQSGYFATAEEPKVELPDGNEGDDGVDIMHISDGEQSFAPDSEDAPLTVDEDAVNEQPEDNAE